MLTSREPDNAAMLRPVRSLAGRLTVSELADTGRRSRAQLVEVSAHAAGPRSVARATAQTETGMMPPESVWERDALIDVVEESVPYRRLAMRVIERALRDIARPGCGSKDRETAREFLAGSAMLLHWCRVATLDPRRVIATAATLERSRLKTDDA